MFSCLFLIQGLLGYHYGDFIHNWGNFAILQNKIVMKKLFGLFSLMQTMTL